MDQRILQELNATPFEVDELAQWAQSQKEHRILKGIYHFNKDKINKQVRDRLDQICQPYPWDLVQTLSKPTTLTDDKGDYIILPLHDCNTSLEKGKAQKFDKDSSVRIEGDAILIYVWLTV